MLALHSNAILLLKTHSGFQFRFPEKVKSFKKREAEHYTTSTYARMGTFKTHSFPHRVMI
jgi:hypothetical protein